MKLQAGNPNLMKTNKTTGLGTFASTLGDVLPKKKDRAPTVFVPSVRDPNAVQAPSINIWNLPVYKPDSVSPTRQGADDHMRYKSKGCRT